MDSIITPQDLSYLLETADMSKDGKIDLHDFISIIELLFDIVFYRL
jgi:Ca2+-binding EF-hand superfamily protein